MAKINWSKAFHDYISDETMSYAKIAEKYGVSIDAVKAKGEEENWVQMRAETKQKILQKTSEKVSDKLADIKIKHIKLGAALQSVGAEAIQQGARPKAFRDVIDAIRTGVDIERKAYGMDKEEKGNSFTQNNIFITPEELARQVEEARSKPKENIIEGEIVDGNSGLPGTAE